MAEVWGGGAGGPIYQLFGNDLRAAGGAAGGYARGFMPVTPGSSLTIIVGSGGIGAARAPSEGAQPGSPSSIYRNQNPDGLFAYGGSFGPGIGAGTDLAFQAPGSGGMNATISFGQRSPTEYVLLVQCGNGGTAYGVQPGISGLGTQIASINSSFLLYQSGDVTAGQQGSFPGGGGGCGYNYGGRGADGIVVLHW
ncbi:MAG: hypothetical protein EAZ91_21690 [Cytophagales bacterium]|nr:MAG: hypothetical protein EAZ91_21690 [Cytophagales bacterium]